jgi:hypothetical protein
MRNFASDIKGGTQPQAVEERQSDRRLEKTAQ